MLTESCMHSIDSQVHEKALVDYTTPFAVNFPHVSSRTFRRKHDITIHDFPDLIQLLRRQGVGGASLWF